MLLNGTCSSFTGQQRALIAYAVITTLATRYNKIHENKRQNFILFFHRVFIVFCFCSSLLNKVSDPFKKCNFYILAILKKYVVFT